MQVDVYRNLRTNGWSIRDSKTKRVLSHKEYLILSDCSFHVSEKGRQRVLKTKQKNVHAFVRGILCEPTLIDKIWKKVRYNPYETEWFLDNDGNYILKTNRTAFWPDGSLWVV